MTINSNEGKQGRTLTNLKLQQVISEIKKIPPAPQILPKLRVILESPNSDTQDIIDLIKVDVSITTQVLKIANSTYFGSSQPVKGLQQAIYIVGFREIWNIVSLAATKDLMSKALPLYHTKKGELLDQSIAIAQIMDSIAKAKGLDESESYYTSGLLIDIGKIVINQYFQQRGLIAFGSTLDGDLEDQQVTCEDEQQLFGFDHAQAGAALLQKWNFAEEIYNSILYQYQPEESATYEQIATSLLLSRMIATQLVSRDEPPEKWEELTPLQTKLAIHDHQMKEILENSFNSYQKVRTMLQG